MTFPEFQKSDKSNQPHLLLLGHPVSHSLSPLMHNTSAEYYGYPERYLAIDLHPNEISSIAAHFNNELFKGANITIPYKEVLLEHVDYLDSSAGAIGAINVIYKNGNKLTGSNTDLYGFLHPLRPYEKRLDGGRAIVFGTGGASRAVVAGLLEMGVTEIVLISRNPSQTDYNYDGVIVRGYSEWPAYAEEAAIIVNTTPLGMEPDLESSPVRETEAYLLEEKICYDIVYKPLHTRFLMLAEKAGAQTIGGLDMLIYQGSKSFELWTGSPFPVELIRKKLHEYFGQ